MSLARLRWLQFLLVPVALSTGCGGSSVTESPAPACDGCEGDAAQVDASTDALAEEASSTDAAPPETGDIPERPEQDAAKDAAEEEEVACDGGMCGDPGCGACPTVPVVRVELDAGGGVIGFGIDSLETTQAEYAEFLKAKYHYDKSGCYDQDWAPLSGATPGSDLPVWGVSFCAALAYCEWAGKRVCRDESSGDPMESEWYLACSNGGQQAYPYGASYLEGACNLEGQVAPVGSYPSCEGALPGLYDMLGNVDEFTAVPAGGGHYGFSVRGGSAHSYGSGSPQRCRDTTSGTEFVGIRCCTY